MMAAKITKTHVLALARKRHGKDAQLRENARALSPEAKQELRTRHAALRSEKKETEAVVEDCKAAASLLLDAARFALDVDGDEPSWTQLRNAVEAAELLRDAKARVSEITAELRRTEGLLCGYRWEIVKVRTMGALGACCIVSEQADTLEEMAQKLED